MKAITKAEFEARLAEYEQQVRDAGEFVGGVVSIPSALLQPRASTSSPASLTDLGMPTFTPPKFELPGGAK